MDRISKIYYINLDRREDRRVETEAELRRLGLSESQWERFPAITHRCVTTGCTKSHLAVLKLARDRGHENVLILEDDFHAIVEPDEFWAEIVKFFDSKTPYDVVMLAYNLIRSEPKDDSVGYAREVQTASAYIVHNRFYDRLIDNVAEGCDLLENTGHHWNYSHDQYWKVLQPHAEWFYMLKRLSVQRPSYSDLGSRYVDYKC